ncbi:MAG: DUF499 domain-containing protein [Chloroflexota bacterium]|nr:DUF499 domain-containing protein [Chloroflexota bacterium]
MAKSNRERVGEIIDLLKSGLAPFVLGQYKSRYRGRYLQEMELKLYNPPFSVSLPDEATALKRLDTQACLKLMVFNWKEAFRDRLGNAERSYANELMTARNDWAHQKSVFANEEARRVAETAKLLLQAVGATAEADACAKHYNELLRLQFERDARNAAKQTPGQADAPRTTDAALKPWRQVIEPHPDVRSGRFAQAEFAADLAAVMRGEATPEYGEARPFFERTYMTEGLRDLVVNGIKRLTGAGGDPVVQLQTNFGGGKTHSMLALYHAFSADFKLSDLRDFDEIRQLAGDIDDDLEARRAVIVGTSFNVSQPRRHADCTTRTIWGEIAYQLGGAAAYELVELNDLEGTNPGADTLVQVMDAHGPALIILDEFVRLTQQLHGVAQAPAAGSFEAVLAFIQSLTEAVKRADDALLLVSIPASEIEIGGEGGYTTLDKLRQTLGRLESVWKPVSAEESYEIVRRRLFSEVADYPARDAVTNAFHKMYTDSKSDFPPAAAERDYLRKMRQAYPIHPEFFERLYEDWSTLERFQRTRGVLRMMAAVIHRLWISGDQSLMVMPGSVPLEYKDVEAEITQYLLPRNYSPVVAADIDGLGSKPYRIDQDVKQLGRHSASRRVARAIFIGSSPTKQTRGIEERRVNLATAQPGERASIFGDALRRMSNHLTYLHNDGARYWYDTRATVNRIADDRAQDVDAYQVLDEAGARLRAQPWDRNFLGSVHFLPENSAEIPDEQRARVVVLGPEYTHRANRSDSEALHFIREIMSSRGNSPRHHRNTLVFIAPDETRNAEWSASIRRYLAWRSIEADKESLNLDVQQSKQVEQALKRESETVEKQLQETYCWLIAPEQPSPAVQVGFACERIRVSQNFLDGAARKLKTNGWLIHELSPYNMMLELGPLNIWKEAPHLSVKKLWDWHTNYCYLDRLFDRSVMEATIVAGVNRIDPDFGFAEGVDENGKYRGLKLSEAFTLYFDDHALIVDPEAARAQLDAERGAIQPNAVAPVAVDGQAPAVVAVGLPDAPLPDPPKPKPKTRYFGSVRVDPQRATRDFNQIADEVILRLASLPGADVSVTVEINCERSDGFDDVTVRAVSENSNTLNFSAHGFED